MNLKLVPASAQKHARSKRKIQDRRATPRALRLGSALRIPSMEAIIGRLNYDVLANRLGCLEAMATCVPG